MFVYLFNYVGIVIDMCDVCLWFGILFIYVYVVVIGNWFNLGYRYIYIGIYWNVLLFVFFVNIYYYIYIFLKRGFKKKFFLINWKNVIIWG